MTGGTGPARSVNQNLAKICSEFGLGMGLGSCRILLESDEFYDDFDLRKVIGDDLPFFANIGIAQISELLASDKDFARWLDLCQKLKVDGFFIHLNPLQEWHQPEGDRWYRSPLEMIQEVVEKASKVSLTVGVKEVGQGMGPRSIEALLKLPLAVLEFSAYGGTNFSYLEQLRAEKEESPLSFVGHSALEMLDCANYVIAQKPQDIACKSVIVSGGIRSSLEGFYLTQKSILPAAYGMASPFLHTATEGEQAVRDFVQKQIRELQMAQSFLYCK
jgi:isopentenyl-diphosphate delta-isomerase